MVLSRGWREMMSLMFVRESRVKSGPRGKHAKLGEEAFPGRQTCRNSKNFQLLRPVSETRTLDMRSTNVIIEFMSGKAR